MDERDGLGADLSLPDCLETVSEAWLTKAITKVVTMLLTSRAKFLNADWSMERVFLCLVRSEDTMGKR